MEPLNHKNAVILLTACIIPNKNMPFLLRRDTNLRLNDYIHTLKKYLKNTNYSIIFADNSGYDLSKLEYLNVNNRIEFIKINSENTISEKGKGYNELLIINNAINESKIICKNTFIIKVTGRLYIKNINNIINKIQKLDYDIFADLHSYIKFADSRFFIAKKGFYDILFQYINLIDDRTNMHFEIILAKAISNSINQDFKWHPIPTHAIIEGISGTLNSKYNNHLILNLFNILKKKIFIRLFKK